MRNLDALAAAMGCSLVYTLVPRTGTWAELAGATGDAGNRAVLHSMALEGQALDDPADRP